ncbi:hypothetical protein FUAX_35300 [Fulvitalea axinellae]|uniref:D-lyxose ketol-isomerase n=1 Tax=Fulvitalea axinellae TaxID=1182444 RepID=A0AAU9CLL5_9BACT|nr:hypothetical protein FUAX_35300 [Fulvitalea axinellae]
METYSKEHFYDNGVFNSQKAKDAYFKMMERFGYPISPLLKTDEFWVSDFSQNDFLNAGMGGIFWINNVEQKYFAHEIFLLPGQMIVEHCHNQVEAGAAKMETWHVRHGEVYLFGEGDPTPENELPIKPAASQFAADGITVHNCKTLKEGEISSLNRLEARHFMVAGPQGAIVSEYASPHYGEALEFTNKTVVF